MIFVLNISNFQYLFQNYHLKLNSICNKKEEFVEKYLKYKNIISKLHQVNNF